jgi:hypothetical protein
VLLGGGIGINGGDLLLPEVRAATAELVPAPPEIRRSQLGERAVDIGAISVGLEIARETIVRRLIHGEDVTGEVEAPADRAAPPSNV